MYHTTHATVAVYLMFYESPRLKILLTLPNPYVSRNKLRV